MKLYKIFDEELQMTIGTLIYYEKSKDFIIELVESLDEWTAPLLLTAFVKKGIFTIPRDISFLWVKERVIPSGRQNIGAILNTHKLKQYEEIDFLELSEGRCSQDHIYIEKLNQLPDYVTGRMEKHMKECVILDPENLLCFFEDGVTKKIALAELESSGIVEKIRKHPILLNSCKIGPGGYCISFDNVMDIPAELLYRTGIDVPLKLEDFVTFARMNILDTSDCCDILNCSRQNISYLSKQNQLTPMKKDVRGNLYLKGEILKNSW